MSKRRIHDPAGYHYKIEYTRNVDLLHIEDEQLLVRLRLDDVDAVPLRVNIFCRLLPLATKYIGKLRLQLMTRRRWDISTRHGMS